MQTKQNQAKESALKRGMVVWICLAVVLTGAFLKWLTS
jgi:hypothetical protein